MVQDLAIRDIYNAIVNDFEAAWNGMAADPTARGRGNFMFARQAMMLLELAARLASNGRGDKWLRVLGAELDRLEPRYFVQLPGPCGENREFLLPYVGSNPTHQLLWAVFDLVRNGGAHQYQHMAAHLTNQRGFAISMMGASFGERLGAVRRHDYHLWFTSTRRGDLWLTFCPDTFFLDVREAIKRSGILNARLRFRYLTRPQRSSRDFRRLTGKPSFWDFDSLALETALKAGGLHEVRDRDG